MDDVIIIGCGDIGRRLAHFHGKRGDRVHAVVRTVESARRLRLSGVDATEVDLDSEEPLAHLPMRSSRLYYLAPPPPTGVTDPRLQRLLRFATNAPPRRTLYISTSGVYGDAQGRWIDESQMPSPGPTARDVASGPSIT